MQPGNPCGQRIHILPRQKQGIQGIIETLQKRLPLLHNRGDLRLILSAQFPVDRFDL
ncbi:Uncharacterised protein [Klebsiella pneumoniae]|nr:Uncharacterised protein [Klebsiella pneumoniae]